MTDYLTSLKVVSLINSLLIYQLKLKEGSSINHFVFHYKIVFYFYLYNLIKNRKILLNFLKNQ